MKHFNPIEELNNEVSRERLMPFIMPFLVPLLIIVVLPVLLHFADVIDEFASRHPLTVAVVCFTVSGAGWFFLGRRNFMW